MVLMWHPGGAWASLPRDTLHVVLTKAGQAGLELSKEATAELEGAEAAAARFSHAASGEPLVNADPQATATAVVAQLAACMPELQEAGECHNKQRTPFALRMHGAALAEGLNSFALCCALLQV